MEEEDTILEHSRNTKRPTQRALEGARKQWGKEERRKELAGREAVSCHMWTATCGHQDSHQQTPSHLQWTCPRTFMSQACICDPSHRHRLNPRGGARHGAAEKSCYRIFSQAAWVPILSLGKSLSLETPRLYEEVLPAPLGPWWMG